MEPGNRLDGEYVGDQALEPLVVSGDGLGRGVLNVLTELDTIGKEFLSCNRVAYSTGERGK